MKIRELSGDLGIMIDTREAMVPILEITTLQ